MAEESLTKWYGKTQFIGYGIAAMIVTVWFTWKYISGLREPALLVAILFCLITGPIALYIALTE